MWQILLKFRQKIPGIMKNESVSKNFDIWNICPVAVASIYAIHIAYFQLLQLLIS